MRIAVITTFPNNMFDVYARQMLESFVRYWPQDIPILVALDDDSLQSDVEKIVRPQDAVLTKWSKEHREFVERNKGKDDPTNYRKQPVRFCHKVFALKSALDAVNEQKKVETAPQYLIWLDADVLTTRQVSVDEIAKCLPKQGDAVAYLGRKDWEHSECGWLAFDLEHGGDKLIEQMHFVYTTDAVLHSGQQHDSWIFDMVTGEPVDKNIPAIKKTNLTADKPGMEIWPQSPMASWSIHYKGPIAKQKLTPIAQNLRPAPGQNFVIQTRNAIPYEEICAHIKRNQELIKNWLVECESNDETIVVVSAGPQLVPEELREETNKIVAVKHALLPLKKAGIKPWACILLDPREHVANFVKEADNEVKWFVASQVNPQVTELLLEQGCEVWGYHASVGAGESILTEKQANAVIHGGSATATRGLFLLSHLGFKSFHLYGYDLCYPDKMDMNARDDMGQPKYLEFSVGTKNVHVDIKRNFMSEPQLIVQFEEMNDILKGEKFKIKAFGDGMIPWIIKLMDLTNLRQNELKCKMGGKLSSYKDLWNKPKKTRLSTIWRWISSKILRRQMVKSK